MPETRILPWWGGRLLALAGIVLVATNLRTAVGALSPLWSRVEASIPVDSVGVGLLGTLPPLCFAIFGLLTPLLRRRLRVETILLGALTLILLGTLVRSIAPSFGTLAAGSAAVFAAAGVANVVLPPAVKSYFPDRIGLVTSLYATVMTLFSLLPPLVAVPAAGALGWRASVGMWAALAVVAIVPWLLLARRPRSTPIEPGPRVHAVRSPVAWAMAVLFGVTAMSVFALFAWLPELLVDTAGVSEGQAGALLSLWAGMGVPVAIVIPLIATRLRSIRPLVVIASLAYAVGYLGLLLAPAAAPVLWIVVLGTASLLFPLTLLQINLRSRTAEGAVALSGFTQGVGYAIGAVGPFVVGVLHQASGGWTVPLSFLLASIAVATVAGFVVARPRFVED